jgi:hypothetical protein
MYFSQHCFICRPSDSTVSEDAGIEPRTIVTTALAVRRSSHSATSHPQDSESTEWPRILLKTQTVPELHAAAFLDIFKNIYFIPTGR